MRSRICPRCGKPYLIGQRCPRCAKDTRSTRTKEQESSRFADNPWRRQYDTAVYRKARQQVIERQAGRCASCGRQVASKQPNGHWSTLGGGVHHIQPLSKGGGNVLGNLVLLCTLCHNRIEAERRRNG